MDVRLSVYAHPRCNPSLALTAGTAWLVVLLRSNNIWVLKLNFLCMLTSVNQKKTLLLHCLKAGHIKISAHKSKAASRTKTERHLWTFRQFVVNKWHEKKNTINKSENWQVCSHILLHTADTHQQSTLTVTGHVFAHMSYRHLVLLMTAFA